MIGKRKRDTSVVSRFKTDDGDDASLATANQSTHDVFRKFFEAQFEPIEGSCDGDEESDTEEDEDDNSLGESEPGSVWDGISGEEDENNEVEVVEYSAPSTNALDLLDKRARKYFMTAKPPSLSTELKATTTHSAKAEDNEDDKISETQNLKNDLALQRLLKESHLLESASELAPTGKNRHKALDLRMQELGAKKSLYHQKMPSSMRKGIKAKAEVKEEKRRREARENGIILEKPAFKAKQGNSGRRERGVGGPSIGKFAGGTLSLSKQDVAAVQGLRRGKGKTRGRGRGRGRGRR